MTEPHRFRALTDDALAERRLVVLANREPYIHEQRRGEIEVVRPASGLVTGIEPLLAATGGVWIAHGGGSADRDVVDEHSRVAVPPESPTYSLHRIWLEGEEVEGYYLGFSNEGLWPLCHLAYTKPRFRRNDYEMYERVNRKFVAAAIEELDESSLVLVQDYHFGLAPKMLREGGITAAIHLFWHIPWPPAEIFRICPWREEILRGMLGADIAGFHSVRYCRNFLASCAELLDCAVDYEQMLVAFDGRVTRVRRYPISIEWPVEAATRQEGRRVRSALAIPEDAHVTVGVDRIDYTKGLLERMDGIERYLERNPEARGKFFFIELASPSRTGIESYRDLNAALETRVEEINERFGTVEWKPVILERRVLPLEELRAHYAAADSCLVTPLHDGMNLVAKEYVGSCLDDRGVLILSEFTGAAEELQEALFVNPYDADGIAIALESAVAMTEDEQEQRMSALRRRVAENTIYDWAASIIEDTLEVDRMR
jgi:trehalose 6-phosphate synthase